MRHSFAGANCADARALRFAGPGSRADARALRPGTEFEMPPPLHLLFRRQVFLLLPIWSAHFRSSRSASA